MYVSNIIVLYTRLYPDAYVSVLKTLLEKKNTSVKFTKY